LNFQKAYFIEITISNLHIIKYKKFDTVNDIITLGTINDDDLVAIIGKGEITITINQ
jgi:hypothetical protein